MVALLDTPSDDVESLARDALTLAWSLAQARPRVGMVIDQPGVGVTLHGPFDSQAQASKFLRGFPFAGPHRPRVLVQTMTTDSDTTED